MDTMRSLILTFLCCNLLSCIRSELVGCSDKITPKVLGKHSYEIINEDETRVETELYLVQCNILYFEEDAFINYTHAIDLDLSQNHLTFLGPNVFADLTKLNRLKLARNSLMLLSSATFAYLKKLTHLDISSNFLDLKALGPLMHGHSLKAFLVSDNNPTCHNYAVPYPYREISHCLPNTKVFQLSNLFRLKFVSSIDLASNRISRLKPRLFVNYVNLTSVDLSNNLLASLPDDTFATNQMLKRISLHNNKLSEIGRDLLSIRTLIMIQLSKNNITELSPNQFSVAQKLAYLDLSRNNIRELDENIFSKNVNLQHLYLSHNALSVLRPKLFYNQRRISTVFLDHNRITSISPILFCNSLKLEVLVLGHNRIKSLPEDMFDYNTLLNTLVLASNQIDRVRPKTFRTNPKMSTLSFSDNKLRQFGLNIVGHLSQLSTLDLSGNLIGEISSDIFWMENLSWMSVSQNDLATIPADTFTRNKGQIWKILYLSRNPFKCSCLKPILATANRKFTYARMNFTDGNSVTCILDYNPRCDDRPILSGLKKEWRYMIGENHHVDELFLNTGIHVMKINNYLSFVYSNNITENWEDQNRQINDFQSTIDQR